MPANSSPVFGPRLRAHRERRGITLAALAHAMKVKQSLLEDLERNDVSRWPPGIYGRAVVREYAKSIGLPASETLEEFCGLFAEPEDGRRAVTSRLDSGANPTGTELRLTLAAPSTQTRRVLQRRVVSAALELAIVVIVGSVLAVVCGLSFSMGNAIVALTWYPARTAFGGDARWSRILRLPRFGRSRQSRPAEITVTTNPIALASSVITRPLTTSIAPPDAGDDVQASGYASIH
jgi:transcriptional regulator with XRE-family HTH domain